MLKILFNVDEIGWLIVPHEFFVQFFYALGVINCVPLRHVFFVVGVVVVVVLGWEVVVVEGSGQLLYCFGKGSQPHSLEKIYLLTKHLNIFLRNLFQFILVVASHPNSPQHIAIFLTQYVQFILQIGDIPFQGAYLFTLHHHYIFPLLHLLLVF